MTPADHHRHTAAACRTAAEIWRNDGSKPHADFASVLDAWAARSDRRALEAESANPFEQMELFA